MGRSETPLTCGDVWRAIQRIELVTSSVSTLLDVAGESNQTGFSPQVRPQHGEAFGGDGEDKKICQPERTIATTRKKFSQCVIVTQTGTPGSKVSVAGKYECESMYDLWITSNVGRPRELLRLHCGRTR
jgi:hypothetical protein